MLKRLGTLIGFAFFWLIAALTLPIVFWVIGGLVLGGTMLHMVLGKDGFGPGHRFFTIVSAVTLLLATGGFFAGGGATEPETGLADVEDALALDDDDDPDTTGDSGDSGDSGDTEDIEAAADDGAEDTALIPVEGGPVDVKAAIKVATAAKKGKNCKSLDAVAAAWTELSRVPADDKQFKKAAKAAAGLEKCRKGAVAALKKTALKARTRERTTLAKGLQKLLTGMGVKLKARVQGKSKDKVTFKGKKVSEEKIDEAFADGSTEEGTLLGRLQEAGFAKVTVAAGKVKRNYELEPEADDAGPNEQIEALGMSETIAF